MSGTSPPRHKRIILAISLGGAVMVVIFLSIFVFVPAARNAGLLPLGRSRTVEGAVFEDVIYQDRPSLRVFWYSAGTRREALCLFPENADLRHVEIGSRVTVRGDLVKDAASPPFLTLENCRLISHQK